MSVEIERRVKETYAMTDKDLVWKPVYANNILGNPLEGYYCLIVHKDKDGKYSGRKYTITFQFEENEDGCIINRSRPELYILHEYCIYEIKGRLDYPKPTEECTYFDNDRKNTLTATGVNNYGDFVRAFKTIEEAKKRALQQYKAIYGYCLSYLI